MANSEQLVNLGKGHTGVGFTIISQTSAFVQNKKLGKKLEERKKIIRKKKSYNITTSSFHNPLDIYIQVSFTACLFIQYGYIFYHFNRFHVCSFKLM